MVNETMVAVLGCGYWGRNHVRNFHALETLRVVCDPDAEGRARAKEIAPCVPVEVDLERVLGDPFVRGVVIATPAETHAVICERVLAAGKDVLCEKPLALRYEDARRVVEYARRGNRILMVGHVLEYHPAILKLRELVAAGTVGKIHYIYSNRLNLGRIRREENILWSFAPHDIAIILRLLGEMPFLVISAGGAYVQPNIADVTVTQLLFDNGVAAHIFVSWLHPFKEQRLVVVGSEAMAAFDDQAKELVVYNQRVTVERGQVVPFRGQAERIPFADDEPLRLQSQAFLEAMVSRRPPLTDGDSGLRGLRVLQAAQRSLVTSGQPILLPLE